MKNKKIVKFVLFTGLILSAGSSLAKDQFDSPVPIPCSPTPCSMAQGLR
jgi:hypothetical protein